MNPMVEPTLAQQRVLDRIAAQRERLRARRATRAQAPTEAKDTNFLWAPLVSQGLVFASQHPLVVLALVGAAIAAGPKRLLRWGTAALPVLLQLRR